MKSNEKIIFLDIDGPVIPYKNQIAFSGMGYKVPVDPVAVHLISKIAERTNAKIVISSQKRNAGREFLDEFAGYGFDESLIHADWATKSLGVRVDEIQEWLARHPEITHWVAIDDEPLDTEQLIMVCPANGFLIHNYDDALNKLGINAPKLSDLFYWKARVGYEGPDEFRNLPETQNAIRRLKIPKREP